MSVPSLRASGSVATWLMEQRDCWTSRPGGRSRRGPLLLVALAIVELRRKLLLQAHIALGMSIDIKKLGRFEKVGWAYGRVYENSEQRREALPV